MGDDLLHAVVAVLAILLPLCFAVGLLCWCERKRPRPAPTDSRPTPD